MPENEFEKKISSEMQGLKFKPSEHVWLRVEERIKTKRKRRVFVIIFLFAGIALLGYWQRSNLFDGQKNDIAKNVQKNTSAEKQKEENSESANEINNSTATNQSTGITKPEETKIATDKIADDKLKYEKSEADKKGISISKKETTKPSKNKSNNFEKQGLVKNNKKNNKHGASATIVAANSKKKNSVVDDLSEDLITTPETNSKSNDVNQTEVNPVENKIDSVQAVSNKQEQNATTKPDTLLKADPTKATASPVVKKEAPPKKWKWGFHITPGISSLNDNAVSFHGSNFADYFSYQSPANSGAAPPRQEPSDVKAGFALQVGAFAQRQLSSRTGLSFGLQYGYYSNVLHLGNRVSSSQLSFAYNRNANQVYNAGSDTIKYTNSYHFAELPILFQWQLNKNKTKPLIWSTGITVGQLITSNAVMYDTAFNGVYYKNKSQLNKTQFSLTTGFSWTIANGKQLQWNLGPVADIHLTRLVDNPFENKSYLFFVGLRTGLLLNSKK